MVELHEELRTFRDRKDWEGALERLYNAERKGEMLSTRAVTEAMLACNSRQQWRACADLFSKAEKLKLPMDRRIFNAALGAAAKTKDWKRAIELLGMMDKQGVQKDIVSYNLGISATGNARQAQLAIDLFNSMREQGLKPNAKVYTSIITACNRVRDWQSVLRFKEEMDEAGIALTTGCYNALLSASALAGQVDHVLALMKEMEQKGVQRDVISFNQAITSCAKTERLDQALALFNQMLRETGPDGPIVPDLTLYNSLIFACGTSHDTAKAIEFFNLIKSQGLVPDSRSFYGVITACGRNGQLDEALAFYQEMLDKSIQPTVYVYTSLIVACGLASKAAGLDTSMRDKGVHSEKFLLLVEGFLKRFEASLLDSPWNPQTEAVFVAAIDFYGMLYQVEKAIALFDQLKQQSKLVSLRAYQSILLACGRTGAAEKALAFLTEMSEAGLEPNIDSYSSVISAFCRSGMSAEAVKLGKALQKKGLAFDSQLMDTIFFSCSAVADVKSVLPALSFFFQTAKKLNLTISEDASACVVTTFAKGGDWQQAVRVLDEMEQNNLEPSFSLYICIMKAIGIHSPKEELDRLFQRYRLRTSKPQLAVYNAMITSKSKAKQYADALEYFHEAERIFGGQLDIFTYHSAITAALKMGNAAQALQILKTMQGQGVKPDSKFVQVLLPFLVQARAPHDGLSDSAGISSNNLDVVLSSLDLLSSPLTATTFNGWLATQANTGDWRTALNILSIMKAKRVNPNAESYSLIITACFKANQSELITNLYTELTESGLEISAETLGKVMSSYISNGHEEVAVALFNKTVRDTDSYQSLINAYAWAGKPLSAKVVLQEALGLELLPTSKTFGNLIIAFGKAGEADKARMIFDLMEKHKIEPNLVCYNGLIAAYGKAGQKSKALAVFEKMRSESKLNPDAKTYEAIISSAGQDGNMEEAMTFYQRLKNEGITPTKPILDNMMLVCSKNGNGELALEYFDELLKLQIQPDTRSFVRVITALTLSGMSSRAVELLQAAEGSGLSLSAGTYNSVMFGCIRSGKLQVAIDLFYALKAKGIQLEETSYRAALIACTRAKLIRKAFSIFQEMISQGMAPNLDVYNSILTTAGRMGRLAFTLGILRRMEFENILPDTVSFNAAINACHRAKVPNPEKAFELQGLMELRGVVPNVRTYQALLMVCGKAGFGDRALTLLAKLRSSTDEDLTFMAYASAISALGKEGRTGEAEDLMRSVKKTPHSQLYSSLLKAYASAGDLNSVQRIWEEIKLGGRVPTVDAIVEAVGSFAAHKQGNEGLEFLKEALQSLPLQQVNLNEYHTMIYSCVPSGQSDLAFALLGLLQESGLKPNVLTYSGVLFSCAKAGYLNVSPLLEEVHAANVVLPNKVYTSLLSKCSQQGNWSLAMKLLEHKRKQGAVPDQSDYLFTAAAASRSGNLELALQIAEDLQNRDKGKVDAKIALIMLSAAKKARSAEIALTYLKHMKASLVQVPSFALFDAISACSLGGDVPAALTLLEEAYQLNFIPPAQTYRDLLAGCLRARQMETILQLVGQMEAHRLPLDSFVYQLAIFACARLKEALLAESFLERLTETDPQPSWRVYASMISLQKQAGEPMKALNYYELMKQSCEEMPLLPVCDTISTCAKAGYADSALRVLKEAYEAQLVPTFSCFRDMVRCCMRKRTNHFTRLALMVLRDMENLKVPLDETCLDLALQACARLRYPLRGKYYFDRLMDLDLPPSRSWKGYAIMVFIYKQAGNLPQLLQMYEDMKKKEITISTMTYKDVASVLCEFKQFDKCLELLSDFAVEFKEQNKSLLQELAQSVWESCQQHPDFILEQRKLEAFFKDNRLPSPYDFQHQKFKADATKTRMQWAQRSRRQVPSAGAQDGSDNYEAIHNDEKLLPQDTPRLGQRVKVKNAASIPAGTGSQVEPVWNIGEVTRIYESKGEKWFGISIKNGKVYLEIPERKYLQNVKRLSDD